MAITLNNLKKRYHDATRELVIIKDLSYTFPDSGSFAIVGRSGVGKSTLLHILGGLDSPSEGEVLFGKVDIAKCSEAELTTFRGANIGFIFQFHHLLPEFSALENVAMPLIIRGERESDAEEKAKQAIARVGLSSREDHRPSELSGGEQQRVAIARAVVAKPKVILADEPTGNLDIETARTVQELLLQVQRELSSLLIVVTHSQELAQQMGTKLEMMPGGELK